MDVIMPLCDGYEATSSIRDAELKNGYPATYICGLSSNDDARKNGVDDFMLSSETINESCCIEVLFIYSIKPFFHTNLQNIHILKPSLKIYSNPRNVQKERNG